MSVKAGTESEECMHGWLMTGAATLCSAGLGGLHELDLRECQLGPEVRDCASHPAEPKYA
eukprot:scaffold232058_cov19-Prasinocladus_malaysianus.AAC.2